MKIVTFNIRYAWSEPDGINGFLNRAGQIIYKIRNEQPDVVCFQEATAENKEFLENTLTEYLFVFNQRNSDFNGEGLMTAINKKTMSLLGLDFFWLSDTPYVAGSCLREKTCPRVCQVLFLKRNADSKIFRIYNNHLDSESEYSRINGIKLVLKRICEDMDKINTPFFILGDFNALPDSETVNYCRNNGIIKTVDLTGDIGGTFHNFGRLENPDKIDYIFTDEKTAAGKPEIKVWRDSNYGVYLSDHYPVEADVEI